MLKQILVLVSWATLAVTGSPTRLYAGADAGPRRLRQRCWTGGLCVMLAGVPVMMAPTCLAAQAGVEVVIGPNHRATPVRTTGTWAESWIAASRVRPDVLVGVAMTSYAGGCGTVRSEDRGETWRQVNLPQAPRDSSCFDPMVVAGVDGGLHVLYTIGRTAERRTGGIAIWNSSDHGESWTGPVPVPVTSQPDHPRLGVDASDGPYRGRLYLFWGDASDGLTLLSSSDDGGTTWSDPRVVQRDTVKLITLEPLVLSTGELVLPYYTTFSPIWDARNDHQTLSVMQSADGGNTFTTPVKVMEFPLSGWRDRIQFYSHGFSPPILAVDDGRESRWRDNIYMVWDDVSDDGLSSIWFMRSSDGGREWSRKTKLNDASESAELTRARRNTATVAVNGEGVVGVSWYDRRDDPSRRCWRLYFSASQDGGGSFTANRAVASKPSCPLRAPPPTVYHAGGVDAGTSLIGLEVATLSPGVLQLVFDRSRGSIWQGHYSGLTADRQGGFHALWADLRSGTQELYTARVDVDPPGELPNDLHRADVTDMVEMLVGLPVYEPTTGESDVPIRLRNTGTRPIYGPIRIVVQTIAQQHGARTIDIVNAVGGGSGEGAFWNLTTELGTRSWLEPGGVSEEFILRLGSSPAAGLDGHLQLMIEARLATPALRRDTDSGLPEP